MITLDIFADITCPWCLLGKVRLQKAMVRRTDHPFALAWQTFQLNPALPAGGMARAAFLRARFGAEADRIDLPLIESARAEGIPLDLAAIQRVPNTTDAHRLLYWAGLEECQTPVMDALMSAYWCYGRDIGERATLTNIAAEAGMSRDIVSRLLASDADKDTIAAREAHARERGITGVPTFILNNEYVISGAQTVDFWTNLIDDLAGPAPADTRH